MSDLPYTIEINKRRVALDQFVVSMMVTEDMLAHAVPYLPEGPDWENLFAHESIWRNREMEIVESDTESMVRREVTDMLRARVDKLGFDLVGDPEIRTEDYRVLGSSSHHPDRKIIIATALCRDRRGTEGRASGSETTLPQYLGEYDERLQILEDRLRYALGAITVTGVGLGGLVGALIAGWLG